ncbi:TetM/TetW/TetO/TetS family tetracycline resistance ribosomal protection protein [Lactobacillus sp. LL6]|uniref:GTP-binding protein n=1 Tax=Lactobacillus sp. LL6 TaxID=2596827 RepID=UPI001184A069|nr:TetM/TetW/TetO/TetS family tetracycline resistance ribosomal protection protein [Lactobacillus sp. LL6]TSO25565.1 TetM/TetW/TetO/TetS family tetracycline resistance ribosomal protection protein [Lactobacillus sp. LL6]
MKQLTAGIITHVDAGKTTLSEAMMYKSGNLRKLGRVDNGDAFLDSDNLEKKRGITIFSHEAKITTDNMEITLLDTPGHVDFGAQTENVLSVLDYAILVISASDRVTSYTRQLWRMLEKRNIPVFIFVNKMDMAGINKEEVLADIQKNLNQNCVDFEDSDFLENVAASDEQLLEKYLDKDSLDDINVQNAIKNRKVFPVYFGSALKLDGVRKFLAGIDKWGQESKFKADFSARVFKITHDKKGERLTWLRILGGNLKAKSELLPEEKINQIRTYNGESYEVVQEASSGEIVAVTGITSSYPGQGIGINDLTETQLKPVLTYKVIPENDDLHSCLTALKKLNDEDPLLNVTWNKELEEIQVELMGEMQLEILKQLLLERFNLEVEFNQGSVLYKETITKPIEAVGHFEPLRHYSEVHFLMEPNDGLTFASNCSLEVLDKNYQHQIMTALKSKTHLGVLAGFPIDNIKITLIGGRASNVHTVGGDFREATSRGVRQGLMELNAQNAIEILEPWYDFRLEIPTNEVGRAMTDIQKMAGQFDTPEDYGTSSVITGKAPVSEMRDYASQVRSYTHGEGSLECIFAGYRKCHNSDEVIAARDYDPMSDIDNTPNSVFCSHGAGHTVVWDKVPEYAQYPYQFPLK